MSKIGKKPVLIPEAVAVEIDVDLVRVKGEKGEMVINLPQGIKAEKKDDQIILSCLREDKKTRSCYGTMRSLINNAVKGVTQGWEKSLEVVGTGFKVLREGEELVLTLGFSHPVKVAVPEDLQVELEENKIIVRGMDKQRVGLFAAQLRKISPPDAYKGKGIRYSDEEIKLKPGKQVKTGAAGE